MKQFLFFCLITLIYSSCCNPFVGGEFCEYQIFTETRKFPLQAEYILDTDKKFIEAHKITPDVIRKALQITDFEGFAIKKVEIESSHIDYGRYADNSSAAIFIENLAVLGSSGGFNQILLLQKNLPLPLIDIPEIPFLTKGIKINEYLNGKGINELKKVLADYATLANDADLSFILVGEPSPKNTYTHFKLTINMNLAVVYEVCRLVPLGAGERLCDK